MNTIRILHVDMNTIMSYSIDSMGVDSDSGLSIDAFMKRVRETDYDRNITYDAGLLLATAAIIWMNKEATFLDLTEPYELLQKIKIELPEDVRLEVTNISYNHDLVEDPTFPSTFLQDKKVPLNKWATALLLSKNCDALHWVHSHNAPEPKMTAMTNILHVSDKFHSHYFGDYGERRDKPYDIVAMSRSPRYLPFRYQHLCDLIALPRQYVLGGYRIPKERKHEVQFLLRPDKKVRKNTETITMKWEEDVDVKTKNESSASRE